LDIYRTKEANNIEENMNVIYLLNEDIYAEVFLSYNNFVQSLCPEIRTNTQKAKFKPAVAPLLTEPLKPIK
jgi:hypothetical protein